MSAYRPGQGGADDKIDGHTFRLSHPGLQWHSVVSRAQTSASVALGPNNDIYESATALTTAASTDHRKRYCEQLPLHFQNQSSRHGVAGGCRGCSRGRLCRPCLRQSVTSSVLGGSVGYKDRSADEPLPSENSGARR